MYFRISPNLKPQIFIQNNKKTNVFLPACHQLEIIICSDKEVQYISDSTEIVCGFKEINMINVMLEPWQRIYHLTRAKDSLFIIPRVIIFSLGCCQSRENILGEKTFILKDH